MDEHSDITEEELEKWLQDAGFQYFCFISWPNIKKNNTLFEFVEFLKKKIEAELLQSFYDPDIFLDKEIKIGIKWENKIAQALCRSVVMIAICNPVYYQSKHEWCGREWAAMKSISDERLSGNERFAILPVIVKKTVKEWLPEAVSSVQHINFSKIYKNWRLIDKCPDQCPDCYKELFENIEKICERIIELAICLHQRETQIHKFCNAFKIPKQSAFADCSLPETLSPMGDRYSEPRIHPLQDTSQEPNAPFPLRNS